METLKSVFWGNIHESPARRGLPPAPRGQATERVFALGAGQGGVTALLPLPPGPHLLPQTCSRQRSGTLLTATCESFVPVSAYPHGHPTFWSRTSHRCHPGPRAVSGSRRELSGYHVHSQPLQRGTHKAFLSLPPQWTAWERPAPGGLGWRTMAGLALGRVAVCLSRGAGQL